MELKQKKAGPYKISKSEDNVIDIDKILEKEWKITLSLLSM